ncbi:RDD family protein [Bacillus sp. FJAT-45350]|uniref:RDD family protein n=1 Tax=Bacillus sp. FJAT-45350 TaxID=2011014 RepID=UPI000BB8C5DE|nr:RDD family protein [Bacillus sp. FJAT-45350]
MDMTYDEKNQLLEEERYEEREDQEKEETVRYRYAGFWMRFWAFSLDSIVVFSLNGILVYPILRMLGLMESTVWAFSVNSVLTGLVAFLYFALLTKYFSQTLGKRVLGLKVIGKDSERLSWSAIIFREGIGRFIIQVFALMYLLYLVVAFSKDKQGIHDMIADTYVVHEE